MEVKINREIREYTEAMFFGLSLRQFFFSALACAAAVSVYFLLKPIIGLETVSWVCVLAAVPFAVLGFMRYNGMTAEQFVWAWIKYVFLTPKVLTIGNCNYYYAIASEAAERSTGKSFHRKGTRQKRQTAKSPKIRGVKKQRKVKDTKRG